MSQKILAQLTFAGILVSQIRMEPFKWPSILLLFIIVSPVPVCDRRFVKMKDSAVQNPLNEHVSDIEQE